MMEGFEDFNFPFELAEVLGCAVLQLLHGHHLPGAVQQGVVPAHLHRAEVPLNNGRRDVRTCCVYRSEGTKRS